jgi:hypothetical protein
MGRVKFQVKGFNIIKNKQAVVEKNQRIARHRQGYAERQVNRHRGKTHEELKEDGRNI